MAFVGEDPHEDDREERDASHHPENRAEAEVAGKPAAEHQLRSDDAQIGLTQTVFFTACAVFSLFLPRLGDLAGRKKVLERKPKWPASQPPSSASTPPMPPLTAVRMAMSRA